MREAAAANFNHSAAVHKDRYITDKAATVVQMAKDYQKQGD